MRYLLLKDVGDSNYLVADFGDFPLYNVDKLLQIFTIEESYLEFYSDAIVDLLNEISKWIYLTGGEFVVDTKMFRSAKAIIENHYPSRESPARSHKLHSCTSSQ